ncbi:N-acetylmuramoyl-L-alanine amidase family protein [Antrihabitans stalactiti]|uniref:N-acetylmuramoyl-L-alanine amidase n=1 Tax=Antrihabitans stalactiti TaxID=2584121 RepID=A0A848KG25_9NOCA|nr:N-acetylmuramoyl-L-alanine amidase [Antrihabitans stalactiti]NMN95160.1 N-acetylmuramoyl-L-alanine amidase [Antrihabitans stalactiti]
MTRAVRAVFVAALATVVMGACTTAAQTAPAPLPEKLPLGAVVVLDPGHNGGGTPAELNRQVPTGRGGTKACNTSGTSTNTGYSEHAFTFDVANRVRDLLTLRGVQVIMTRNSDDGVGPCVDERAAIGNRANAAAVVSIHGDGNDSADARGFHVAYSAPPLNDAQGEPSIRLATTLRDALAGAGFVPSNYVGSNGLNPREDLAGLNLSERPSALIECANMRDPIEAAILSSPDGRQHYAEVIANGIVAFLG